MNNTFGERLKELRIEKRLGQVALAEQLHISKGIVSMWENGLREPTMSNLISLARFFDVSIDYLVGLKDY